MSFISEHELKSRALRKFSSGMEKNASTILTENNNKVRSQFDVFISHSTDDADLILGLVEILKDFGLKSYVDWLDDPLMDRKNVNTVTARILRHRIKQSKCLLYAYSENSTNSKWMPWELGYADGEIRKVVICPISNKPGGTFKLEEYLGIYPYLEYFELSNLPDFGKRFWIYGLRDIPLLLTNWI